MMLRLKKRKQQLQQLSENYMLCDITVVMLIIVSDLLIIEATRRK
jgi:hypothetical protein